MSLARYALWLAGYEQGRTNDLQLTAAVTGSTMLNITHQTSTPLGGKATTIALSAAGLHASTYNVALQNTSTNSSNWYIPALSAVQTGQTADWLVQIMLNGKDITGQVMDADGLTFNATATALATAGLVLDPNTQQTLSFTFTPLNANAGIDPYTFELTGLAHRMPPTLSHRLCFQVVPEPSAFVISTLALAITLRRSRRSFFCDNSSKNARFVKKFHENEIFLKRTKPRLS